MQITTEHLSKKLDKVTEQIAKLTAYVEDLPTKEYVEAQLKDLPTKAYLEARLRDFPTITYMDVRFAEVDKRFNEFDKRFDDLAGMIYRGFASVESYSHLEKRVAKLESKIR